LFNPTHFSGTYEPYSTKMHLVLFLIHLETIWPDHRSSVALKLLIECVSGVRHWHILFITLNFFNFSAYYRFRHVNVMFGVRVFASFQPIALINKNVSDVWYWQMWLHWNNSFSQIITGFDVSMCFIDSVIPCLTRVETKMIVYLDNIFHFYFIFTKQEMITNKKETLWNLKAEIIDR